MKSSRCQWLLLLAILLGGSIVAVAQGRIQMVQGRRAIKDKVSFVVDVSRQKNDNPLSESGYMQLRMVFTAPATGMFYVDGKPTTRFDEAMGFNANQVDAAYGRHTMTVVFASPAIITDFSLLTSRGVPREILEEEALVITAPNSLEQRVVDLERKVHELETELATIKKKRAH
jgi:hypothetical protein